MEVGQFLYFTNEGSYFGQKTKEILDLQLNVPTEMILFDTPEAEERFERLYTDVVGNSPSFTMYGYYDVPQIFFASTPSSGGGVRVQYIGGFNDLERFIKKTSPKSRCRQM